MKLKIISDGTVAGTNVVNAETGETVEGVTYAEWNMHVEDGTSRACVFLSGVQIEAIATEATVSISEAQP